MLLNLLTSGFEDGLAEGRVIATIACFIILCMFDILGYCPLIIIKPYIA